MADVKTDYLQELNTLFDDPTVMAQILETRLPSIADIAPGTDMESAAIAVSQYCANVNKFLQVFSGLPLLKYLLMGCAFSPVFQSINLSGLEVAQETNPHDVTPFCPVEGQTFQIEEAITFAADITGVGECDTVFVSITGVVETSVTLQPVGGFRFACRDAIGFQTAGAYVATFQGWFGSYLVEKIVHFDVIEGT